MGEYLVLTRLHYSIMPATPMFKGVLMAQLDDRVSNAIRRQCELVRGI